MKKSEIIKALNRIAGDPEVTFSFSNSENMNGNMWTYYINEVTVIEVKDSEDEEDDDCEGTDVICLISNDECLDGFFINEN